MRPTIYDVPKFAIALAALLLAGICGGFLFGQTMATPMDNNFSCALSSVTVNADQSITFGPGTCTPVISKPVISNFTATPSRISAGGKSNLTFDVSNGAAVTMTGCSCAPASGMSVLPTATTTYVLTATNPAGSTSASVTVTVGPAQVSTPLISVGPGYIRQNPTASSSGWKINTPQGGDAGGTSPMSSRGGGIGTAEPLQWGWSFDAVKGVNFWISNKQWKTQAQALLIYTGPACDGCNAMAYDQTITIQGGPTANANVEADMENNDHTANKFHMFGFQCNRQQGNPAYNHFEIDNQGHGWVPLPVSCAEFAPGSTVELGYMGHWDATTQYYDYLWVNGKQIKIGMTLPVTSQPTWGSFTGFQHQFYVSGSSTASDVTTVASRVIHSASYIVGTYNPDSTSTANPALQ